MGRGTEDSAEWTIALMKNGGELGSEFRNFQTIFSVTYFLRRTHPSASLLAIS